MQYRFTLYIAGRSALAVRALANFERFVAKRLAGDCQLETVDILDNPQRARNERVLATPLLVRENPVPTIKILGSLSDEEELLARLGLVFPDEAEDRP